MEVEVEGLVLFYHNKNVHQLFRFQNEDIEKKKY